MENFKAEQPSYLAETCSFGLLINNYWWNQELIDSLENVNAENLQVFIDSEYFSKISIESLLMGNLTAKGCKLNNKSKLFIFFMNFNRT